MLQWMGGSRRKVTTSRKSIQKRQKQYFEQRRQQQHQQTVQLESLESEGKISKQHNRDHRSLDILNLQNFSTSGTEQKPAFHSGREDSKANASTDKYHAITNPQILRVSTVHASDFLETNQASSPLPSHVETLSSKKLLGDCDNCRNEFNKTGNTPNFVNTRSQQALSLYDLLSDDEANGSFQEGPTHESHVAFSVDGLGKVGIGTPPCSPHQSDRFISYGYISPTYAARRLSYPRNHNYDRDGIKYQMDDIMQDAEASLSGSCMDLFTGTKDSYKIEMKNFSRDSMNLDSQEREVGSQVFHGQTSCNARNNHEDLWDGRTSFVDTDFLHEKKCDLALTSRPYHPEVNSLEFLELGNDELPNYNFDHVQQKRNASQATEMCDFLDPCFSKHQTSDHSPDFINPRGARRHFVDTCFEFGDVTERPDCSPYVLEDDWGSLSFLSEESSSSTAGAVKAKINDVSLVSSTRRDNRKHHSNDFPSDHDKTACTKEKHFENKDGFQKRKSACWSEMPKLLYPKSGHFLPEDRIGPHKSWLFEQEYGATETNFGSISASPTIERKRPSAGSRAFGEHFLNENFCLSEDGAFSESPPSRSCISMKCTSFRPATERHSKAEFLKREPEFSCNLVESELESRFTEPDAFCHGELGSVSKSNEYEAETPKLEDKQIKPSTEKNTCSSKESTEGTVETRLPEKRSDKSESSVNNGIEHNKDEQVPPGCERENKVHLKSETAREGRIAKKIHTADDASKLSSSVSLCASL